jgi:methanethiol S-methyltransferase
MKVKKHQVIAIFYGALCHCLFAISIAIMAYSLFCGMGKDFCGLSREIGLLLNFILILQFPFLHSFLLSKKGKLFLTFFAPEQYAKQLSSTIFVILASLQILFVFVCWTPSGVVLWKPEGGIFFLLSFLYLCSWSLLVKSMCDAGLSLQIGSLGWCAVYREREPKYPTFTICGLNKYCRQPIYLSFALILAFAPVWTLDHLLLTMVWGFYCFYGPRLKEQRQLKQYGKVFNEYQRSVPYWNFFKF